MENEESSATASTKPSAGGEGWLESFIIRVSQTSLGQSLLKHVDRFLWVVEKSAQWSLPCPEVTTDENGKSFGKVELVRPLPWILFLPALVILRAIRGGVNVGAFILGYPQIQPSGMVKLVQKSRRRLRALNLKAVKNMRHKTAKDKRLLMIEAKKALITSIRLTLSTLSCLDTSKSSPSPPPTKIRISGSDLEMAPTPDEKSTTESAGSPIHTDTKRKFSEVSSDEASTDESENDTLQAKIDRLALEDSIHDPDFDPADCSTESSTTSNEIDDADMHVSLTELEDVRKDSCGLLCTLNEQEAKEKTETNETKDAHSDAAHESPEEAQFHSPDKVFGPDGDATFYSPVSSKNGTPERSMSPCIEKKLQERGGSNKSTDFINGEIKSIFEDKHPAALKEEVTNGVVPEKRNANSGKFHNKGKRTNHGNRRKK